MEQEKRSLKLTIQREIKINLQKQEIFHKNEEFSDFTGFNFFSRPD